MLLFLSMSIEHVSLFALLFGADDTGLEITLGGQEYVEIILELR